MKCEHFNLAHAAFVYVSVFRDFPKGTVHLVSVHAPQHAKDRMIAMKVEEHYFVGIDNGLFSLVTEKQPTAIVELIRDNAFNPTFPEKTILSSTAVSLASGISIYNVGKQITEFKQLLNRMPRITKEGIYGSVIHVDNYGNLITNISKEVFDKVRKDRNFTVSFAREITDVISDSYESKENADCVVVFQQQWLCWRLQSVRVMLRSCWD